MLGTSFGKLPQLPQGHLEPEYGVPRYPRVPKQVGTSVLGYIPQIFRISHRRVYPSIST